MTQTQNNPHIVDNDILITQFNMQVKREAKDELLGFAKKANTDLLLIQEPYQIKFTGQNKVPLNNYNQIRDGNAVTLVKKGIQYTTLHTSKNIVAISINNIHIINVYASPNDNNRDIQPILNDIDKLIPTNNTPLIIGGDFNTGTAIFKSALQKTDAHNKRKSPFILSLPNIVYRKTADFASGSSTWPEHTD